jgi:predicted DNA-binding protein (MmcQ/YjbR family)
MNVDWVRERCLLFPHATEQITWGNDLTFRVNGKIFAVTVLEPAKVWLSFKASPDNFAELTERIGIIPAPYMARAQWVALETKKALPADELARLLRESYEMVIAKLPKKIREQLAQPAASTKALSKRAGSSQKRAAKGARPRAKGRTRRKAPKR